MKKSFTLIGFFVIVLTCSKVLFKVLTWLFKYVLLAPFNFFKYLRKRTSSEYDF